MIQQKFPWTREITKRDFQGNRLLGSPGVSAAMDKRPKDEVFGVVSSIRFSRSYKREFIRGSNRFIREKLSVQLWSVNQRTTEAKEVTDL
jgi:hypothetical protein